MLKVYLKELLELTRDKKTLIFTILLPTLIMPVIMLGFITLSTKIAKKAVDEDLSYAIVGGEYYPELVEQLVKNDKLKQETVKDIEKAKTMINANDLRFAIVIPEDAQARLRAGLNIEIKMLYNDSATTSAIIFRRVNDAIKDLKEQEVNRRYAQLGLSEAQGKAINNPIELIKTSTADKRESFGEKIGGFLPYILILIGLSGAMYPAIDIGVGEKERGTLETLLLTPVPRFQLVLAKFLVIFTTSFVSVFFSLISFGLMIGFLGPMMLSGIGSQGSSAVNEIMKALATISSFDVFLMFLMLVPVAAIFASVLLSVSIYARTFKEAQNYMSPLMMLVIFPLILPLLPGVKLDWVWASVPITNVSLAIKEIFKGTIDMGMLAVIFVSTTVIAGLLLGLCNWWFQREQVLFRN
ncbi:ABC transporter permease [Aliikangiella maris]|uniref:ABC transporter permease n=2 Tax=Aliikangiella maris TaxID=3162458 RepID=A0ABV3MMN3_9GAMM